MLLTIFVFFVSDSFSFFPKTEKICAHTGQTVATEWLIKRNEDETEVKKISLETFKDPIKPCAVTIIVEMAGDKSQRTYYEIYEKHVAMHISNETASKTTKLTAIIHNLKKEHYNVYYLVVDPIGYDVESSWPNDVIRILPPNKCGKLRFTLKLKQTKTCVNTTLVPTLIKTNVKHARECEH